MQQKLVSTPEQAATNVRRFAEEVGKSPDLQAKLGHVHAWYAVRIANDRWAFGSSKFVGYQDNTAKRYQQSYQDNADGRETEKALEPLSREVDESSRVGRELKSALEDFLSQWNRKPRSGARIRIVAEAVEIAGLKRTSDAALLDRISSDPNVCGGRPCIKGTRMRVADIMEALAHGATQEELLRDFDYISADDIAAALLYSARASDHRVVQTA